jgi:very-short-patch-repair endonuclease
MPEDVDIAPLLREQPCGAPQPHPADVAIAALAAAQHGVVARRQLSEAGVTPKGIEVRMRAGRLIRLHRGVYAVGHGRLRREGWWLAAVLAVGDGAGLSHREAAALHGIRLSNRARIDVTTATRGRARLPGIELHGSRLDRRDVVVRAGIPVTTVARTLVDLAGVVPPDHLARALSEAERVGVLDVDAIEAARRRLRGRRGPGDAVLRAVLGEHRAHGATLIRSYLEERFLALVEARGLPRPRINAHVEGYEVDALWARHRLVVELDGYAFHHTRRAFQGDRSKANALMLQGYVVLRYTYDDVTRRPDRVAAQLRARLGEAVG